MILWVATSLGEYSYRSKIVRISGVVLLRGYDISQEMIHEALYEFQNWSPPHRDNEPLNQNIILFDHTYT